MAESVHGFRSSFRDWAGEKPISLARLPKRLSHMWSVTPPSGPIGARMRSNVAAG